MKATILVFMAMLMLLTGCGDGKHVGGNYKECYGIIDSSELRDDKVAYELQVQNVIASVIFVETIAVPIWLVGFRMYCPVGSR